MDKNIVNLGFGTLCSDIGDFFLCTVMDAPMENTMETFILTRMPSDKELKNWAESIFHESDFADDYTGSDKDEIDFTNSIEYTNNGKIMYGADFALVIKKTKTYQL